MRSILKSPAFAGAALLPVYALIWIGGALSEGFTHDDLMNIQRAVFANRTELARSAVEIWRPSPVFRPAGAIAYRALWAWAGFRPVPYHAVCLALFAAAVILLFFVAREVLGSTAFALAAAWACAYHGRLWPLYSNTGTIYDLLANFFYFGALCALLWTPRSTRGAIARVALAALCSLAALNSKETAVSLPAALMAAVFLTRKADPAGRRRRDNLVCIALVTILTAAWALGRVLAEGGMTSIPGYVLTFSPAHVADNWAGVLSNLIYAERKPGWLAGAAAYAAPLALFALLGWRTAVVAWIMAAVSYLPLAFIPPRGLDASFLTLFWMALAAAAALQAAASRLKRPQAVAAGAIIFLTLWHASHGPIGFPMFREESESIRKAYHGIAASVRGLPHDGRVVLIEDHFEQRFEWATVFMVLLSTGRDDLFVHRAKELESGAGLTDGGLRIDVALRVTPKGVLRCRGGDGSQLTLAAIREGGYACEAIP
jgi:hypothetical protein